MSQCRLKSDCLQGELYQCYYGGIRVSYPTDTGLHMIYFDYTTSDYDTVTSNTPLILTIHRFDLDLSLVSQSVL